MDTRAAFLLVFALVGSSLLASAGVPSSPPSAVPFATLEQCTAACMGDVWAWSWDACECGCR